MTISRSEYEALRRARPDLHLPRLPKRTRMPGVCTLRGNKYHNKPRTVEGIWFQSGLEAGVYIDLRVLQRAGEIVEIERQVPFKFPCGTIYLLDFRVTEKDGTVRHIEAKGHDTGEWKIKQRMMAKWYPDVTIEIVRKAKGRT